MRKEAKIKIGIIIGVIITIIGGPFAIGAILGGGSSNQAPAQITLRFWNLFDEQALYEGTFQEYAATQPNTQIRIEYKKYTNIAELESDLINELAEGKGPDIVSIHPSWLQKHLGKLAPMPASYFDNAKPERFRATFVPAAAEDLIVPGPNGEEVYALPVSMDTLGVIYNQDFLLNNLKLGAPPEDWDTFTEEVVKFARTNNAQTRVTRTAVGIGRLDNTTRGMDLLQLLMMQFGTKFYDQTGERVTIADPTAGRGISGFPASEAMDFFTSFATKGTDTFLWDERQTEGMGEDLDVGAFVSGNIGMIFAYPYQVRDVERLISQYQIERGDVIPMEVVRVGATPQKIAAGTLTTTSSDTARVALANYYPLAVTRNSKNQLAAWDYINFLTKPEQQRYLFVQGKKITANLGVVPEQVRDPIYGAFARQSTFARSIFMPEAERMKTLFTDQVTEVLDGKIQSLDAVRNIQQVWQCYLNKMFSKPGSSEQECRVVTYS